MEIRHNRGNIGYLKLMVAWQQGREGKCGGMDDDWGGIGTISEWGKSTD
jgi:hypothetical protein